MVLKIVLCYWNLLQPHTSHIRWGLQCQWGKLYSTPFKSFMDYWSQGQTMLYVLVDIAPPPWGTLTLFIQSLCCIIKKLWSWNNSSSAWFWWQNACVVSWPRIAKWMEDWKSWMKELANGMRMILSLIKKVSQYPT